MCVCGGGGGGGGVRVVLFLKEVDVCVSGPVLGNKRQEKVTLLRNLPPKRMWKMIPLIRIVSMKFIGFEKLNVFIKLFERIEIQNSRLFQTYLQYTILKVR